MSNVVKFKTRDRAAQRIECSACGAAGMAGCECGAPYVTAGKRAEEAVAANPEKSDRAIAEEIGVGAMTVSRARKKTTAPHGTVETRTGKDGKQRKLPKKKKASAPAKPRKLPKPPKLDPDVVKQSGYFHTELMNYTEEYCERVKTWARRKRDR